MPRPHEAKIECESLPENELQAALDQRMRNRQAAAMYLQAATMTDNVFTRKLLRRRAADLILRRDDPGPRAC